MEAPTAVTVPAWVEGQTPCQVPGCDQEAYWSVDGPDGCGEHLCWDHMCPRRDAGQAVFCLYKVMDPCPQPSSP